MFAFTSVNHSSKNEIKWKKYETRNMCLTMHDDFDVVCVHCAHNPSICSFSIEAANEHAACNYYYFT